MDLLDLLVSLPVFPGSLLHLPVDDVLETRGHRGQTVQYNSCASYQSIDEGDPDPTIGFYQRIYISDRRVSTPLRCPREALTQPLSACSVGSYTDGQVL